MSGPVNISSGVPRGSVLGPTRLLLYFNDICEVTRYGSICLFADDFKLYNLAKNAQSLQDDLDSLANWSEIWQLNISFNKCCVLHLGKFNPKTSYNIYGRPVVNNITEVKDLGVYICR